jgi:hypothetical protein
LFVLEDSDEDVGCAGTGANEDGAEFKIGFTSAFATAGFSSEIDSGSFFNTASFFDKSLFAGEEFLGRVAELLEVLLVEVAASFNAEEIEGTLSLLLAEDFEGLAGGAAVLAAGVSLMKFTEDWLDFSLIGVIALPRTGV